MLRFFGLTSLRRALRAGTDAEAMPLQRPGSTCSAPRSGSELHRLAGHDASARRLLADPRLLLSLVVLLCLALTSQNTFSPSTASLWLLQPKRTDSGGAREVFLLTDIHVDPLFDPTHMLWDTHLCRSPAHTTGCPSPLQPPSTTARFAFGRVGCDPPVRLLDSALQAMRELTTPAQPRRPASAAARPLLILLGDTAAHSLPCQNLSALAVKMVIAAVEQSVPGWEVLPVFGNQELLAANTANSLHQLPLLAQLYGEAGWLSPAEQTSFNLTGYYARTVDLSGGLPARARSAPSPPVWLQIVALNTILWSVFWSPLNGTQAAATMTDPALGCPESWREPDPKGQFEWLERLLRAEQQQGQQTQQVQQRQGQQAQQQEQKSQLRRLQQSQGQAKQQRQQEGGQQGQHAAQQQQQQQQEQAQEQGQQGQQAARRVLLVGHVPPGDKEGTGVPNWCPQYLARFRALVRRYQPLLEVQFYGHHSYDDFRLQFASDGEQGADGGQAAGAAGSAGAAEQAGAPAADWALAGSAEAVMLVNPGLSPRNHVNPAFRRLVFSWGSGRVQGEEGQGGVAYTPRLSNVYTHMADLERAAMTLSQPSWHLWYDMKEAYDMQDLSPRAFSKLLRRLSREPVLFAQYKMRWQVGYVSPDTAAALCDVRYLDQAANHACRQRGFP